MKNERIPTGQVATLTAAYGPIAPYAVELLLAERVPLDTKDLSGLEDATEIKRLAEGALSIAYLGHPIPEGGAPMVHLVSYVEGLGQVDARHAALQQTWDWPDPAATGGDKAAGARAAMSRARAVLLVNDMPVLPRVPRLRLFERLLRRLIARLPVLAIHWVPSQRMVDPATYTARDGNAPFVRGAVNVRLFNIGDGAPGEKIMDTMGLAALGLRDFEHRFAATRPDEVAERLYSYANYVFERGEDIPDGDTVDGAAATWRCRHDVCSVAPSRKVVRLESTEPAPYADAPVLGVRCPACGRIPTALDRWECDCGFAWNTFDTAGCCPACDRKHTVTACPTCKQVSPHEAWYAPTKAR